MSRPGMKGALPSAEVSQEEMTEDPSTWLTADVERVMSGMSVEEREEYVKDIERIRSFRKAPFGSFQQKLALEKRAGYYTHWFNDTPGRVDAAEQNGWTHRKDPKTGGSVKRVVGSQRDGSALYAYAMDIPTVFREEDMALRHKAAQDRMDDIKKNPIRARQGQARAEDRNKFYSPKEEAISVKDTVRVEKRAAE